MAFSYSMFYFYCFVGVVVRGCWFLLSSVSFLLLLLTTIFVFGFFVLVLVLLFSFVPLCVTMC